MGLTWYRLKPGGIGEWFRALREDIKVTFSVSTIFYEIPVGGWRYVD